jgi:hypothetical protein
VAGLKSELALRSSGVKEERKARKTKPKTPRLDTLISLQALKEGVGKAGLVR